MCGESEICELDYDTLLFVLFTHQILGFQISVHDSEVVHVVESQTQLVNDTCCLLLCEISPLFNCVEKITPCDKLHYDIVVAGIFH